MNECGELRLNGALDDGEVCVGAGTFSMGDSQAAVPEAPDYTVHGPAHDVTLAAYALDTQEVTVVRYRACVTAGACTVPLIAGSPDCTYTASAGAREHLPVTCVRWYDAEAFCAWDGNRRLPTEAEWERAARGTTGNTYAWGNDTSCSKAVWASLQQCTMHAGLTPKAVGSVPQGASLEGALDLTGNAWEWVNDWFGAYPTDAVANPQGPDNGTSRIQRGGNWQTPTAEAAAFMRRAIDPDAPSRYSSFRCARSVPAL